MILRQVVNFALRRELIHRDPLKNLQLKKPKLRPQPCWTVAEVEQILAAAGEQYRGPYTVLADTGMRVGELQHLTWADVDFKQGLLHIREKEGWKPKTGDERVVHMTDRVQEILRPMPQVGVWVFTARASTHYPRGDRRLSSRRMLEHLKRILKPLGLKGHVHTFRHHFISTALTRGTPEAVVRQWVGHVDREVMKRYTHVAVADSKAAMAKLSSAKAAELAVTTQGAQA